MKTDPKDIYGEYIEAGLFKNSVGDKGISEQNRINERFYKGDQWRGAGAGSERPLVRHNVIKRIGDFKMSSILSGKRNINYVADGIPQIKNSNRAIKGIKKKILGEKEFLFSGTPEADEINFISCALSNYREFCDEKLGLEGICVKALKDAYVSGTGIVYSFWDPEASGGKGDIGCEVLSVDNVFFGDPYIKEISDQPFIIISGEYGTEAVCRMAMRSKASAADIEQIKKDGANGKVLMLTKLYKQYFPDGSGRIFCTFVTENAVVRKPFDTKLCRYPLSLFCFEERNDMIYGDSEITYLIPNQIAINRMITANVWSSMSSGMPMMVVNGDTVTGEITNDPGQIIKVYGSNEDVKGAVSFVSPPDFSRDFCENINNLIENTLTQSGATAAVLGDEIIDNASAIMSMKNSAVMSLRTLRCRYNIFLKNIALSWADIFLNCYYDRRLRITDENGIWYFPFTGERYKGIEISAEIAADDENETSSGEKAEMLLKLFEKGIIDKSELLKRFPDSLLKNADELLEFTGKDDSE